VIISVTLNPSLDRTLEIDALERGAIVRTAQPILEPGGKGVNVTRALAANDVASIAVLPVGGIEGTELGTLLNRESVRTQLVPIAARTRSNITLVEPDGTVTKINEPGSALSEPELATLIADVEALVSRGDWVVLSGSLPPGMGEDALAAIAAPVVAAGGHIAIDTSGDALDAAVAAVRPRLIKPNRDELCQIVGRPVGSIADVISAALEVQSRGVDFVLVSLGADGAVLVAPGTTLVGVSRVDRARNTVGAGDCFLAGFLSRFSRDEAELAPALLEALAWGASAASLPGTSVPAPADIENADVQLVWQPDLDRPLVAS
jgi:1-phosphofructokinase